MKIGLRKKSRTILLSLVVMCLMFGSMGVKASPDMWISDCSSSIKPGETIYLTSSFEFENIWQGLAKEIFLYYSVNSYAYDNYKTISNNDAQPEQKYLTLSTSGLGLEDGDVIRLKVACDWGVVGFVKKGTLEDTATVNVYEDKLGGSLGLGAILGIVFGSIALTTIVVITIVRSRKKKAIREAIVK